MEGRKYGNLETQKLHDRTHKQESKPAEHAEPDGDEGMKEEQPIEDSMQEHGPVSHIEMHSHHEDGHVHKSTHHDHHSAKHHVMKAFGQKDEPPMEHDGGMGDQMGESMGGGIPTLGRG